MLGQVTGTSWTSPVDWGALQPNLHGTARNRQISTASSLAVLNVSRWSDGTYLRAFPTLSHRSRYFLLLRSERLTMPRVLYSHTFDLASLDVQMK